MFQLRLQKKPTWAQSRSNNLQEVIGYKRGSTMLPLFLQCVVQDEEMITQFSQGKMGNIFHARNRVYKKIP